jgi:hypothetical protein
MANTTITPNMNLPVPVPGEDPGPDWANNIVADMYAIDGHTHTAGQGVAITPAAIDVNTDLPMNNNSLTSVAGVTFQSQSVASSVVGTLTEVNTDLYFTDGAGNQIRITQSGSVAGSTGTITGLPSGTASASYSAGTFTFQSATSTPATMAVGPLVIGRQAASSKTVGLAPNVAQASNFDLTLPVALPTLTSAATIDTSGNMGYSALASGTYTPTLTASSGTVGAAGTFFYTRIGNTVFVSGSYTATTTPSVTFVSHVNITLPFNPTSNFADGKDLVGVLGIGSGTGAGSAVSDIVVAQIFAKTALATWISTAAGSGIFLTVQFTYSCA